MNFEPVARMLVPKMVKNRLNSISFFWTVWLPQTKHGFARGSAAFLNHRKKYESFFGQFSNTHARDILN